VSPRCHVRGDIVAACPHSSYEAAPGRIGGQTARLSLSRLAARRRIGLLIISSGYSSDRLEVFVSPGELSSFDTTTLQENSRHFKKPLVIASPRQERRVKEQRSLLRGEACQLARRCVGLFIVASRCSESHQWVARCRVRRSASRFAWFRVRMLVVIAQGGRVKKPALACQSARRCIRRLLVARSLLGASLRLLVVVTTAPHRRIRELVAVGNFDAREFFSTAFEDSSLLPQQRARRGRHKQIARRSDSLTRSREIFASHQRVHHRAKLLAAAAESSSLYLRSCCRTS